MSVESATVCYINPTFAGILGGEDQTSAVESAGLIVGQQFVDVLQLQLVSPSATIFLQWINGIITENNSTPFRSQFKNATKSVTIKWTGVLVHTKSVVLTGRISSSSNLPSPELNSRLGVGNLRNEDITPPPSSTDSSPHFHRSTSPVLSRQNSPVDCRSHTDSQEESQATWRNTEKVLRRQTPSLI